MIETLIILRWCLYKYCGDKHLKEHLLAKHKNEFKEVILPLHHFILALFDKALTVGLHNN